MAIAGQLGTRPGGGPLNWAARWVGQFAAYHRHRFGEGAPVLPVHVTNFVRFIAPHWRTPEWQNEHAGAALRQHVGFPAEGATQTQDAVPVVPAVPATSHPLPRRQAGHH
jgi:hypothetical protein